MRSFGEDICSVGERRRTQPLHAGPNPGELPQHETDRIFYQDIWYDQEMAHGYILDQFQEDLGLTPTEPFMAVQTEMKLPTFNPESKCSMVIIDSKIVYTD